MEQVANKDECLAIKQRLNERFMDFRSLIIDLKSLEFRATDFGQDDSINDALTSLKSSLFDAAVAYTDALIRIDQRVSQDASKEEQVE